MRTPQFSPFAPQFRAAVLAQKKYATTSTSLWYYSRPCGFAHTSRYGVCLLFAASAFAADEDGTPAPRFHAKTTSGETFNNDSIKGKVVLLEFWTSWCVYCHQEEALVEEINKEFTGKGLVVLANPNSIVWE
jgi:thiol-disulfide isomerase/thioredoxin